MSAAEDRCCLAVVLVLVVVGRGSAVGSGSDRVGGMDGSKGGVALLAEEGQSGEGGPAEEDRKKADGGRSRCKSGFGEFHLLVEPM